MTTISEKSCSFGFDRRTAIANVNSRPTYFAIWVWFHCRDRGSKFKLDLTLKSGPPLTGRWLCAVVVPVAAAVVSRRWGGYSCREFKLSNCRIPVASPRYRRSFRVTFFYAPARANARRVYAFNETRAPVLFSFSSFFFLSPSLRMKFPRFAVV